MARRKRVEGPSAEELRELEAGFAAKPASNPFSVPPIAQVAGDAAAAAQPVPIAARAEAARDHADAERLREAEAAGRLAVAIPLSEIETDEITRDRLALDREELDELKASIAANGLRLPVEVFELTPPRAGRRYGLISGYRRVAAMHELKGAAAEIAAFVRRPGDAAEAFVAMVEENEVRSEISQYERGRIAALTVEQGTFADIETAVARLYASASKAKRSKIRSFALIHEELGDALRFPQDLSERGGLRLAMALRLGFAAKLRETLETAQATDAETEWRAILPVIEEAEARPKPEGQGGRPRSGTPMQPSYGGRSFPLTDGVVMESGHDGQGFVIRFRGKNADASLVEAAMEGIARAFGGKG
ncbi:ParB/RepB/Spo0J family partition protein [Amaricoccus macauensis]|uniref:ParB/RepB/Spo0J family partition protein n=1 Tax=Amaricoccus macauensis TaxID=57001 RepID=UPI003C7E6BA3